MSPSVSSTAIGQRRSRESAEPEAATEPAPDAASHLLSPVVRLRVRVNPPTKRRSADRVTDLTRSAHIGYGRYPMKRRHGKKYTKRRKNGSQLESQIS